MSIITESTTPALLTCPEGVHRVERWLQKGHYHVNGPKPEKTNIHPPLSPKFSQNCTFRDNREVFTSLSNPLDTLEQQQQRRQCSSSRRGGLCQIREYVGASICIRVTKPSLGRTIGSSGFMGVASVGWGSWCNRLHQWDATVCGGEGWMQPNISSGSRERITNQNRSFLGKLPKA